RRLVLEAHARGSPDNLTAQLVRIDALPDAEAGEVQRQLDELALPPLLEPPARFEGYRILRELHASSRSHVYLAEDEQNGERVVWKTPSLACATTASTWNACCWRNGSPAACTACMWCVHRKRVGLASTCTA